MRAKAVNFEKTGDPMKTMKIGSHRELTGQKLIDKIFDNVYTELKDDPKFAREDELIFKDDVYQWVLAMVEDPDTGETASMTPEEINRISASYFHEFWDETYVYGDEPTL